MSSETPYTAFKKVRGLLNQVDLQDADHYVFDIETTGLTADAETTLVAYIAPNGSVTVLAQDPTTDTVSVSQQADLEAAFNNTVENRSVTVRLFDTERDLLTGLRAEFDALPENAVLVAYNGKTYHGGFDVSHLRTRALVNGVQSPLDGQLYMDIKSGIVDNNGFNLTEVTIPSQSSLSRSEWDEFASFLGHPDPSDAFPRKGLVYEWVNEQDPSADTIRQFAAENDMDLPTGVDGTLDGVYDTFTTLIERADEPIVEAPDVSWRPHIEGDIVAERGEDGDLEPVGLHCIADVIMSRFTLDVLLELGSESDFRVTYL